MHDLISKATSIIFVIENAEVPHLSESLKTAISHVHIAVDKYLSSQINYIRDVKNAGNIDSPTQINIMNRLDNTINEFEEAYDDLNEFSYTKAR